MSKERNFLLLQGFTSHFLTLLGNRLSQQGHKVTRVNFNCGDTLYGFGQQNTLHYRASASQFPRWLEQLLSKKAVSDIIIMGDMRPVHRPVKAMANARNIRVHVFEEGYFRPNLITLEQGGVNANSALPTDPAWYLRAADKLPEPPAGKPVANPIWLLAGHEICYHLPNLLNPILYPGYRTHRLDNSAREFYGWARRFSVMPWREKQDKKLINTLIQHQQDFYLLPLQLDCDSQIQHHSPFKNMAQLIEQTMSSFALHAPQNTLLVIKNHPLDTGFVNYRKLISQLEKSLNIQGRTLYLESGDMPMLLRQVRGVITVNSTVGPSAMIHRCPTLVLGKAIYNLPGLAFPGTMDEFWQQAQQGKGRPDMKLFGAFRKVVCHATQLNGSFYSLAGVKIAVEQAVSVLAAPRSPLEQLLADCPLQENRRPAPTAATVSVSSPVEMPVPAHLQAS